MRRRERCAAAIRALLIVLVLACAGCEGVDDGAAVRDIHPTSTEAAPVPGP